MASGWDLMTYTLTGTLGLGILIGAKSEHQEEPEGWNPPVLLDEREPAPPQQRDWLSPAKLQQMTAGPRARELPGDDAPVMPDLHAGEDH
jgi:hypothetical protein